MKIKTFAEIERNEIIRKRGEMIELYEFVGSFIGKIHNGYDENTFKTDSDIIELMKLRVLMDIKDSINCCSTKMQHVYESIQVADNTLNLHNIAKELEEIKQKLEVRR